MGYAAIPWYIISAITFFIPFAFMIAEFGAAYKNEKVEFTRGWRSQSDHVTLL